MKLPVANPAPWKRKIRSVLGNCSLLNFNNYFGSGTQTETGANVFNNVRCLRERNFRAAKKRSSNSNTPYKDGVTDRTVSTGVGQPALMRKGWPTLARGETVIRPIGGLPSSFVLGVGRHFFEHCAVFLFALPSGPDVQ